MSLSSITNDSFGSTKDGEEVTRYTLTNEKNVTVRIIDFGACITDILLPDRNGVIADINLGYDDMEGYTTNPPYIGAVCGRVANRIAGGKFELDGKEYSLFANNGPNSLHGGLKGFDKYVWKSHTAGDKISLTHVSKDGEEGYPGEMTVTLTYQLTADSELILDYTATTTAPTLCNLSNHAYFNLAGHDSPEGLDEHLLTILADNYLPLGEGFIPTGEISPVEGTAMDMRNPVKIADRLADIPGGKGLVQDYCIHTDGELRYCAKVEHPPSGRFLEMLTTEPAIMTYTSYYLDVKGKGGAKYRKYGAFCLEAQNYTDSIHQPKFPNSVLRPGETYKQTTVYKFGAA